MPKNIFRRRRIVVILISAAVIVGTIFATNGASPPENFGNSTANNATTSNSTEPRATDVLAQLVVKGKAPMTSYTREKFGNSWNISGACDMRNQILQRDMTNIKLASDGCVVESGTLNDPYTGKVIQFVRGAKTSSAVQIDHAVAIGNAWRTGAQNLSQETREKMYLDPLELLAVDGPTNEKKSDGDAATWLPPNKSFRCTYIARQIAVKKKYSLWVTPAEHDAMAGILAKCPDERVPAP